MQNEDGYLALRTNLSLKNKAEDGINTRESRNV